MCFAECWVLSALRLVYSIIYFSSPPSATSEAECFLNLFFMTHFWLHLSSFVIRLSLSETYLPNERKTSHNSKLFSTTQQVVSKQGFLTFKTLPSNARTKICSLTSFYSYQQRLDAFCKRKCATLIAWDCLLLELHRTRTTFNFLSIYIYTILEKCFNL